MKSILALAVIPLILFASLMIPSILQPLVSREEGEVVINETGSSLVYPLAEIWVSEYSKIKPKVKINIAATGSGMGITQAGEGVVDIGATDAYIYREDLREKYGDLLHIPVCIGGVAIIFNIPGVNSINLTADVISKIYLGEITNWSDEEIRRINPGVNLPNARIIPIYRSDSSGTTFLLSSWLSVTSENWNLGYGTKISWRVGVGGEGSQGLTELVKMTPYSIGYVGLAWAEKSGLGIASIYNPTSKKFVKPSVRSLHTAVKEALRVGAIPKDMMGDGPKVPLFNAPGESYPITGFIYFLIKSDQRGKPIKKAHELRSFLIWVVDAAGGQKYVTILGFSPLPEELSEIIKGLILNEVKWP